MTSIVVSAEVRIERDFLGELDVPAKAYYGIHSRRAQENFALDERKLPRSLIKALALVKKSAVRANQRLGELDSRLADPISAAAEETARGDWDAQFVVHPLQGGAGTAANMNMNEVLANRANELLGFALGSYDPVKPLEHVNLGQSTNDVFPTAVRIALIWELRMVTHEIATLQEALQKKETEFAAVVKIGRTQLQDAVPITLGEEFSAYAEAISRDRWRLYHLEERLRTINLGGTAIGTGINANPQFPRMVIGILRDETGLGLARADNLVDATQNADVFAEVSGLLKPLAVNLTKLANDLRLLSSGPLAGIGEIILPPVQEGSSIMPGKVNPVMCEMINQVAVRVFGNDAVVTQAAAMGQLELNAFLPAMVDALLDSMTLLKNGIRLFRVKCIEGLVADVKRCEENLRGSLGLLTVLSRRLGHQTAAEVYREHLQTRAPVSDILRRLNLVTEEEISRALADFCRKGNA